MEYKLVENALNKFGKYVIQQSKSNLSKDNMNSGDLYNTLAYDLTNEQSAFLLDFIMEDYGMFQDAGVFGKNPSLVKNGKQKGKHTDSVFTGAKGIKNKFSYNLKMPPLSPLMNWAKYKNIRFRDSKGQYKRGNYKTIGFWLQKRIFAQGLKPTLFFSKPFKAAFNRLPEDLLKAFKLDVERQIIYGETK
tara:strand:+ start:63 stop:632 length:570 start_codon:yes stop_codon:yes gene_type:complete